MKKNLLYAALVALCLTGLTACGSDGDDAPKSDSMSTPAYADEAMAITGTLKNEKGENVPVDIVLSEKGYSFYSSLDKMQTRAGGTAKYLKGFFTFDKKKNEYQLMDSGKRPVCSFTLNSSRAASSSKATFTFPDGKTYTINVEISKNVIPSSELTDIMCRSWKIAGARLRHYDGVTAVKQFQLPEAASLNAILDYAKTKATIDEDFEDGMTITDITLTYSGKFIIYFENGTSFVAYNWDWSKLTSTSGTFTFDWESQTMKTKFEDGTATFDLRPFGQKNYYTLTMGSTIHDRNSSYKIELSFYLEEAN